MFGMGNRNGSEAGRRSVSLPRLNTNWNDIDHTSTVAVDPTNGMITTESGAVFPVEVMQILLSYFDLSDMRSITEACQLWKTITTKISFWKSVCEKYGVNWASIPAHIKNKPNVWILFYSICQNKILQKNLLRNHSGEPNAERPLKGWRALQNGGDRIIVEAEPHGISMLPPDPFFDDSTSAIVMSYGTGEMTQSVKLWSIGLNPSVMKLMLPFKIEYTQMVGARFDCGAQGHVNLCFYDLKNKMIFGRRKEFRIVEGSNWSMLKMTVVFADTPENYALLDNIASVEITLNGRDTKFWAGHYGPKFARSCIKVDMIHNPEESTPGNDPDSCLFDNRIIPPNILTLPEHFGFDFDSHVLHNADFDEDLE